MLPCSCRSSWRCKSHIMCSRPALPPLSCMAFRPVTFAGMASRAEGSSGGCSSRKASAGQAGVPGAAARDAHCPTCRVPGCEEVPNPEYNRKYWVCAAHAHANSVLLNGCEVRFCQQCGRFHPMGEFGEGRRSCQRSLDRHTTRRRRLSAQAGLKWQPRRGSRRGSSAAVSGSDTEGEQQRHRPQQRQQQPKQRRPQRAQRGRKRPLVSEDESERSGEELESSGEEEEAGQEEGALAQVAGSSRRRPLPQRRRLAEAVAGIAKQPSCLVNPTVADSMVLAAPSAFTGPSLSPTSQAPSPAVTHSWRPLQLGWPPVGRAPGSAAAEVLRDIMIEHAWQGHPAVGIALQGAAEAALVAPHGAHHPPPLHAEGQGGLWRPGHASPVMGKEASALARHRSERQLQPQLCSPGGAQPHWSPQLLGLPRASSAPHLGGHPSPQLVREALELLGAPEAEPGFDVPTDHELAMISEELGLPANPVLVSSLCGPTSAGGSRAQRVPACIGDLRERLLRQLAIARQQGPAASAQVRTCGRQPWKLSWELHSWQTHSWQRVSSSRLHLSARTA